MNVHALNPASMHSDSIIMMQQEENVPAVLLARFLLQRISHKSIGLKLE